MHDTSDLIQNAVHPLLSQVFDFVQILKNLPQWPIYSIELKGLMGYKYSFLRLLSTISSKIWVMMKINLPSKRTIFHHTYRIH